MKKFTSLVISCSLALAGVALAQEPEEQGSEKKGKRGAKKEAAAEANPGKKAGKPAADGTKADAGAAKSDRAAAKTEKAAGKKQGAAEAPDAPAAATTKPAKSTTTTAPATADQPATEAPAADGQAQKRGKRGKGEAKAAAAPEAPAAADATTAPATADKPGTQRQTAAAKGRKPDPQKVQQIRTRHANFRAQPRPQQVPAVTFQQNYRIQGADRWQGPQYEVYRSYRPERHDRAYYDSRYQRVELIGGGYYYWNNGYWYPAWGYSPQAEYYAYDAPIYVGKSAEPPDKVIATVQAALQEMGHYKGEVDGLLGPLTREALTAYQAEQGLVATAVIDQPTLDSLGMG